jgi:hypothetical protein
MTASMEVVILSEAKDLRGKQYRCLIALKTTAS